MPYGRWCFLFLAPIDAREDTTIGNVVPPKVEAKDPASNSCTNGDHQVVEHHVEHCMERFHPLLQGAGQVKGPAQTKLLCHSHKSPGKIDNQHLKMEK